MPVSSATSAPSRSVPFWSRAGCQRASGSERIARRTGSVTAYPTENRKFNPCSRKVRMWARKAFADPALSARTRIWVLYR